MNWWAVGTVGQVARLVMYPCNPADAQAQVGAGESAVPVSGPGEWVIGDGKATPVQRTLTPAETQVLLVGRVKVEAERRKMASFSPGNGKAQEYVQKGKEAVASAGLLATALNALTAASASAQYPLAHAERLTTGETLANVLASYRSGKAGSEAELARLSAIERRAVLAIKAAPTAAAKQAAFSSINWNQTF